MLETFSNEDYNRAAGFLESIGLNPVDLLSPPTEIDWLIQKRGNEAHVWTAGRWTADICRTSEAKQLKARLTLEPAPTGLDSVLIEPENIPKGMTFESFEADMLARFAAWIAQNGREALGDSLVTLRIQTRHAHTLLDTMEDYLKLAIKEQDLDLAAAVTALRGALRNGLP